MKSVGMVLAIVTLLVLSAGRTMAQEFPKPGPEHEQLKQLAGDWDAQLKLYPPGGAAQESKGTYTAKLDVGGYFLVTVYKGEILGGKFQGRGLTGFDPNKKKYIGVWVDSMSPSIYHVVGEFDKAGKVYSEAMEGPDPQGKPMKWRMTTEIKDKDHLLFKMYGTGQDGKEGLTMEIAYSRKK